MKNSVIALSCLTLAAGVAAAQTTAPLKVCILQAQAALESTKDGQAARADLEKRLGPKSTELQKKETELRDLQDRITRGGNTLSQTAMDDLKRSFDSKKKTFDRESQDFNDEAQAAENKVLSDLSEKLKRVIDKFRQDNGYSMILNVSDQNTPIVSFSEQLDCTQAIIDAYDKTVSTAPSKPAISVTKPPVAPPASAAKPPAAAPPQTAAPKPPAPAPAK